MRVQYRTITVACTACLLGPLWPIKKVAKPKGDIKTRSYAPCAAAALILLSSDLQTTHNLVLADLTV